MFSVGAPAVHPGGGIAKTLAAVFAPAPGRMRGVVGAQMSLAPLARPAQLTPGAGAKFLGQQSAPAPPQGMSQPRPQKMKDLVQHDAAQIGGTGEQRAVEHKLAATQKAGSMDFHAGARTGIEMPPPTAQRGRATNVNRTARPLG